MRAVADRDDRHQEAETGSEGAVRVAGAGRRDRQLVRGDGDEQRHIAICAPGLRGARSGAREAERTRVRPRGPRGRYNRRAAVATKRRCKLSVSRG